MRREAAVYWKGHTEHEAGGRAAQPEGRCGDLLRLAWPPDRLVAHDLLHRVGLVFDEPNAAALVSLVQAAGTLPMMLLALPGGVLADSFDRRWLLITVQGYLFVVALLLAALPPG